MVVGLRPYEDDLQVQSLVCNTLEYLPLGAQGVNISTPQGVLDVSGIGALLFTSKNAPLALEHSLQNTHVLAVLKSLPSFVLAPQSARWAQDLGFQVAFVGQRAQGALFAQEVLPHLQACLQTKSALYVRAQHSAFNLGAWLQAHVSVQELIAYTNKPLKLSAHLKPPPHSILIFSAPSAYKAFVFNFGWDTSYRAIALGESTYRAFESHVRALISPEPSLQASVALAKELASCVRLV